jgi:tetratricopeptide (TPR) repeat protein
MNTGKLMIWTLCALSGGILFSGDRLPLRDQTPAAGPLPKDYEAVSLLGRKLIPPAPDPAAVGRYDSARGSFAEDPNEENYVWLGRRLAYLGRYREAIGVFGEGLKVFPRSYRLFRHRGHRYITIRQFGRAIADFEKAAGLVRGQPLEVEADGVPNKIGRPLSNVQFNIFYHLGLAYYLAGEFEKAEKACRECLAWSKNDDLLVATTDWLYLTLRWLGKDTEARKVLEPIRPGLTIVENGAYYERLLMYKGLADPESWLAPKPGGGKPETEPEFPIRAYGLAQARLWKGDEFRALDIFDRILKETPWAAFAHIAAEADVARIVRRDPPHSSIEDALASWIVMWNLYDLSLVDRLFLDGPRPSYFSSEKPGVIRGLDALVRHHGGFGFVPGGKVQDNRLWLDDVRVENFGPAFLATARWFFDKDVGAPGAVQHGPVTFVFVKEKDGFRIAHAHFAND